jgi:hypothetical protein
MIDRGYSLKTGIALMVIGAVILGIGIMQAYSAPSSIEPSNEDNWKESIQIPKEMQGIWCPASRDGRSARYTRDYFKTKPPCQKMIGIDVDPTDWTAITEYEIAQLHGSANKSDGQITYCTVTDRTSTKGAEKGGYEFKVQCKTKREKWNDRIKMWVVKDSHKNEMLDLVTDK